MSNSEEYARTVGSEHNKPKKPYEAPVTSWESTLAIAIPLAALVYLAWEVIRALLS